jgi:hypothetical protein
MNGIRLCGAARGLAAVAALLAAATVGRSGDVKPPEGFTALFNGKDLTGWHGQAKADPARLAALPEAERKALLEKWMQEAAKHWTTAKGELVHDGGGDALLTTDAPYGDVELLVEYQVSANVSGGVSLRGTSYLLIGDPAKLGGTGSGALPGNSPGAPGHTPLLAADKAVGEWNSLRILQVGERTTVHLNGKLVVHHARMENAWDRSKPLPRVGPVQLGATGGTVRWRNLFVRPIPSTEANAILRKHGGDGYVDVFNGKDFTGWAGPIDQYEVKDGAIVCRPKKGGTIYTKDEYSDFMARVEYQLPPAGNNGLAIRYPGSGDTAYLGMCEIQVLDDTAKQYAKLDARQYNGSAYGMVPAHRGYLRPVGEWNFEEVTIVGPTIKVELNGTLILDCDLSKVTEYMGKREHPGKNRTTGHFGFAGHNDPVAFRNIQIKRLDKK